MAVILKNKTTIYGLVGDLAALQAADATELARAEAAELVLTNNLAAEAVTARAAELLLTNNLTSEASRATAAEGVLQTAITAEETARIAAVSAEETARIAGDAGLQTQINNVLSNVDGVALNSLTEIVTAFQAADGTLNGAITTLASTASTALAAEATTARAAELLLTNNLASEASTARAAELVLTTDLATEVSARTAADSALDVALKAYADNAATQGGSLPKLETLVVSANKIVLSKAPKSGINGIMNFGTVRYMDSFGMAYDAPVSVDGTDLSGKTFIVSVDASGDWDGKSVSVQYIYINV